MRLLPLLLVALALAAGAFTWLAWQGAGAAARAELEGRGRALGPVVQAALDEALVRAREATEREQQRLLGVARRARLEVALPLGPLSGRLQQLVDEEAVGRLVLLGRDGQPALACERSPAGGDPEAGAPAPASEAERGMLGELLASGRGEGATGVRLNAYATAHRLYAAVRTADGGALLLAAAADDLEAAQRGVGVQGVLDSLVRLPDVRRVELRRGSEAVAAAGEAAGESDLAVEGAAGPDARWQLWLATGRVDALVAGERLRVLLVGGLCAVAALATAVLLAARERAGRQRRARAQAAEREQQRLAEMGVLTGLFVHEVSNPLNALGLQLEALRRAAGPAAEADAARIKATLARVRQSLESFLSVATPMEPRDGEAYDVARLSRTLDELRAEAPSAALALEVDEAARTLAVPARVAVLDRALRNLVRNALQAAPAGSSVRIRWAAGRGGLALAVRDPGAGFPAEVLAQGGALGASGRAEGHGLGLFLARRIVEGLGGRMELENPPGGGAEVRVWLPVATGGSA
ncbi:MAG: sensor histidine kinase [Planctomycetia bacterium]